MPSKKSGFITVTYATLGGQPRDVALAEGSTVQDFLSQVSLDGVSVKVNGSKVTGDYDETELSDGDRILINPKKVEGGRI